MQIVRDNWEVVDASDILQKVKLCGDNLSLWGKKITGCFGKRINECKLKLKQLHHKRDNQSVNDLKKANHQLFLILDQKEIFWRQRSEQLWLQSGNKNTKYFHAACNTRQHTNHIHKLKNEAGEWVDWQSGIQSLITQYYTELFEPEHTNHD